MKTGTLRLVLAAVTAMLVVSSAAAPVLAQSADTPRVAQQSNETNTSTPTPTPSPTPTPAAGECDPSNPPKMETARLFTREDTITTDQAGTIAGGFLPPVALQCDVVVRVTMQVPNNMYIQGATKLGSGGAGIVSSEFTIPSGTSSVESVRANVYASETGQLPVTADITYWPKGYPDLERSLSGLTLNFDVQEPNEPSGTSGDSDSGTDGAGGSSGSDDGTGILEFLDPLTLAIIGLIVVGTAAAITVRRVYINS